MFRLLPFLLCLACTSSNPYERGATPVTRPPQPTYTPNGAGLREVRPGVQSVPRSPHSRVLPPSKEPGLWSGDQPRASSGDGSPVRILGLDLPVNKESKLAMLWANTCASVGGESISNPKTALLIEELTKEETACLAAILYARCLDNVVQLAPTKTPEGRETLRRLYSDALEFSKRQCKGAIKDGRTNVNDISTDAGAVIDSTADAFFGGIQ